MNEIIMNTEFFNKSLIKYEIKNIKEIFNTIGGIICDNKIDCSQIKDNISIELFYNLEPELRAKILKHIFKTDANCCAWSISIMEENKKIPIHMRSNHLYPKTYKLDYTVDNKSSDIIVKELLSLLELQIEKENKEKKLLEKSTKSTKSTKKSICVTKLDNLKNNLDNLNNSDKLKNIKKVNKTTNNHFKSDKDNDNLSESVQTSKIDKKKKKAIPPTLKIKVWNKHIGDEVGKTKCMCCKLKDIYQASFSCGHIVSEFNGGELKLDNLIPICTSCNSSMGVKNMNEYINEFGF